MAGNRLTLVKYESEKRREGLRSVLIELMVLVVGAV